MAALAGRDAATWTGAEGPVWAVNDSAIFLA